MESLAAIWKVLAAGIIVWRLANMLLETAPVASESSANISRQQRFPVSRAMDCLYWASVWMSAQTTIWVICGFTGVLLNWFAFSSLSRLRSHSLPEAHFAAADVELRSHAQHESGGAARLCL